MEQFDRSHVACRTRSFSGHAIALRTPFLHQRDGDYGSLYDPESEGPLCDYLLHWTESTPLTADNGQRNTRYCTTNDWPFAELFLYIKLRRADSTV